MKTIKLISTLLAVLMLMSAFAILAGAEDGVTGPTYSTNTGNGKSLMKNNGTKDEPEYAYKTGEYILKDENGDPVKDENGKDIVKVISTPEEKIALMDYRYGTDKYELYVDAYSGEVAIRSKATGETLFTNPYNIGQSTATATNGSTKDEIMSQLIVNYTDITTNTGTPLYSYTWSAVRDQIKVMNIKGGIRVEYTIGREENRSLLPHMLSEEAYKEIYNSINSNIEAAIAEGKISAANVANERKKLTTFDAYYMRASLTEAKQIGQSVYDKYCKDYPILKEFEDLAKSNPEYENFAIYVLDDAEIGDNQIKRLENIIKEYYPDYTYQDLDEDHAFVKYVSELETYPLFKMALEYTIEDSGLVVRLPANGIRFNEALYRLDSIEILPYMGAGMNPNSGYTFFPDGSGTLFDFEEIAVLKTRQSVSGKVYGQDYAYHEPSGMYEEIIRYPVFGIYEQEKKAVLDARGNVVTPAENRGFVGIIEEGDSLMELATSHGGIASEYNTIRMSVYPRPTDSYNIADAISVGTNTEWTVVSSRKYTGSYKVRYIMLTDENKANEAIAAGKTAESYYDTSYVGMAKAYRDYLIKNGVLTKLTDDKVEDDIPLYIEAFGALETTERFLSIPINVMTPLTSFKDIQTMYENLKGKDITNVNFIMKGFTKGGMTAPAVPYNLKWENVVSKEMDFEELTAYAKEENFGLFPDFDFVFSSTDTLFDGLTLNKHAAKTIDDRYSSKREYSATKHTYVSYFELAISPAYFSHFYEKFIPKYEKYAPVGISVSTLGSYLNSDFDEDDPYNRADGQNYTVEAFKYIKEELADKETEIMTSGGNAYSWKYVNHITDISLDSSRFAISSASVPFLGMVLHGYVEIAGTPINMEGNLEYAFLKSVESGAAMKFILSYRNTEKLKDYETLSKYYSVNYDIWYDDGEGDLVQMYQELNALLKDVQTSTIVGHEFIAGVRVPDSDELVLDAEQAIKDAIAFEEAMKNADSEEERRTIFEARQLIIKGAEAVKNSTTNDGLQGKIDALQKILSTDSDTDFEKLLDEANKALAEYQAMQLFNAINTDYLNHSDRSSGKSYKIEDMVKAYKDNKSEWNTYKAVVGEEYAALIMAFGDAEKAYAADKSDANKKAVDDAKEALRNAIAGPKVSDVSKYVNAMNELMPLAKAWAESGDATVPANFQTAYDNWYTNDLLTLGFAYKITFEDTNVGGSQYYRDIYKGKYHEAVKALDAGLNDCYADATEVLDEIETLKTKYSLDRINAAAEILKLNGNGENSPFSGKEFEKLQRLYGELVDAVTNDTNYKELLNVDVYAIADAALAMYEEHCVKADAANVQLAPEDVDAEDKNKVDELDISDILDYEIDKESDTLTSHMTMRGVKLTWTAKAATDKTVEKPTMAKPNTKKYESDKNMIVLETFDNGKQFLLNFNDYSVVVKLNGATYTLDAYGYIVIANAAK